MMEPFGLTIHTKKSIIDFRLGSKYATLIEEVAFSKISKFSQKIIILEYSFSKVVGLKEKCNSNFCVAPKNRLVKITKKLCHKQGTSFYWFFERFCLSVVFHASLSFTLMKMYHFIM